VLNFEKCHFMVEHGIVIRHVGLSKGLEVDKVKVEIIQSLPYPKCVKEVTSCLCHVRFYSRFVKDFLRSHPRYVLYLSKMLILILMRTVGELLTN